MHEIYLDNNATTQIAPEVLEALLPFLAERYGNPSSLYTFGRESAEAIEKARAQVSRLVGARIPSEIVFMSGGTESNTSAIYAACAAFPQKKHIITTRVEHSSVRNTLDRYEETGYRIDRLHVDRKGRIDLDEVRSLLCDDTVLVSIMCANNETGVIFPITEIGKMLSDYPALFHSDAVQAAGKISLDVNLSGLDMLSLSSHKLHGPKGVGALYVRRSVPFAPLFIGGRQEKNRRAGTENVAGIVGLGRACERAHMFLESDSQTIGAMRDAFETAIIEAIPQVFINGDREHRLPNTTNISFEGIDGEAIVLMLDKYRICASSGAACTSGAMEPSHVLRAMGIPYALAKGAVRFSLSHFTTKDEIDFVVARLKEIVLKLRDIVPTIK